MTNLVIDASAGVELLLATPVGRALQPRIPGDAQWWTPEHYFTEVAGALRRLELAGTLQPARAAEALASLATAPINRVQVRPLLSAAWSKRHNLTMADALYVVVAEHLGASLVTSGGNLARSPTLSVPRSPHDQQTEVLDRVVPHRHPPREAEPVDARTDSA